MRKISCCFTGHRVISNTDSKDLKLRLADTIIDLITKGYCHFYTGGALGFDTECAKLVLELKEIYSQISLHLILPCQDQTRGWNPKDIALYGDILLKAESIEYMAKHYFNGCMQKRNRALVEKSNMCVSYLNRNYGGSYYTVKYAEKQNIKVINLYQ